MRIRRALAGTSFLAVLMLGCAPRVTIMPTTGLPQGQPKTLVADVTTTPCTKSLDVFYRPALTTAAWLPSSPYATGAATQFGALLSSVVPESAAFPAGATYEFKWVAQYETYYPPPIRWFVGPCAGTATLVQASTFLVAPPVPTLSISPGPATLPVVQGGSATWNVGVVRGGGLTGPVSVAFRGNPAGVSFSPSPLVIGAASTSGATNVTAAISTAPGQYTITFDGSAAGGTVTDSKTALLQVTAQTPTFTLSLTPSALSVPQGGSAQFTVSVTRAGGFTGAVTVTLTPPSAGISLSPLVIAGGSTSATATLSAASSSVLGLRTVTVKGTSGTLVDSKPLSLTVSPPPPLIVVRATNLNVQTFDFANTASPALVGTLAATTSTGGMTSVVGLASDGAGNVVRASTLDVQAFTVSPTGALALTSTRPASTSVTGVAVCMSGSTVVRASEMGLQLFTLASGALQPQGTVSAFTSLTGVAVDVSGTTAVRGHNAGIEVFSIANPAAPTLLGNVTTGFTSTTGVGVKLFAGATRAVRAHNMGLEVYDVTTRTRLGTATGSTSTTGVAVTVNAAGTLAVRAHNMGIEVYDISNPAGIVRVGTSTGSTSTTGTAVTLAGTLVFRATDMRVEAYDVSAPTAILNLGTLAGTTSTTGVGVVTR